MILATKQTVVAILICFPLILDLYSQKLSLACSEHYKTPRAHQGKLLVQSKLQVQSVKAHVVNIIGKRLIILVYHFSFSPMSFTPKYLKKYLSSIQQ